MINIDKVRHKLSIVEDNLSKLDILKNQSKDDFLEDFRNVESAKHLLQLSIESMMDICDHIIARNRLGVPETSADSIRILAQKGYFTKENTEKYIVMTKFRNKVVHMYTEIKAEEIFTILQNNLYDFKMFISEILKRRDS